MKKTLLIITISFIIISCKKNEIVPNMNNLTYDTIFPLSYFPAYPGSYWIYSNGDTLKIEDEYELFYYNNASWTDIPDIDTLYLPKFKTNSIYPNGNALSEPYTYVYKYTISTLSYRLPFRTILSEQAGYQFNVSEYFSGNAGYGCTVNLDTTIEINNKKYENVLVVINYAWHETIGYLPWSTREYYANNIGLIKRESRYIDDLDNIILNFELRDYKVNK
mgnify:FL=1